MKLFVVSLVVLMGMTLAADVPFSLLVSQGAVTNFNIKMRYRNDANPVYIDYPNCLADSDDCVGLTWDDGSQIQLTLDFPERSEIETAAEVAGQRLSNPTNFEIEYCFETPFTKDRKWRKPKDVIQDDKRCPKKLVKKTAIPFGDTMSYNYTIKSNMPGARYFVTLYVFCRVEGSDKDEFCGLDTTGDLNNLAKAKDIAKRTDSNAEDILRRGNDNTSGRLSFRTTVIDSRPTVLVVMVIVMSIVSVSMLVLYFVYERVLKKET